jgi:hypothetical protein
LSLGALIGYQPFTLSLFLCRFHSDVYGANKLRFN